MFRVVLFSFVLMALIGTIPKVSADDPANTKMIVFEGTVLKVGARMPASGQFIFYRLAKYRINRVCSGSYAQNEIVVDHLSLFKGEELKSIERGDRVCVAVRKERELSSLSYEDGLRDKSDKIDAFYVGGEVVRAKSTSCECEKEAIYYLEHRSAQR